MENRVAIILLNYKQYAVKYLADCFNSLKEQDYLGEIKIFIVDNASSLESFDFLKKGAPGAEIIRNENNDGFAKGNNDAIKIALKQNFSHVLLINMDTISDKRTVSKMMDLIESEEGIGAVQARLMLHPETELVNSLGNSTHFLGFGYCLNYRDNYQQLLNKGKVKKQSKIFYPSGAAVLFKSSVLQKVGLFDETYWMYNEDQDLGWRIWLAGYSCLLAEDAIVYHKYEFSRSVSKYYFMDRNRTITILKNYHVITLLLIIPAVIIMELGLLFFSVLNGSLKEKFKTWAYFFQIKNWQRIISERRQIQNNRCLKEKEIVKLISGRIWYQEVGSPLLRLANFFLNIYFYFVKLIVRFLNI